VTKNQFHFGRFNLLRSKIISPGAAFAASSTKLKKLIFPE